MRGELESEEEHESDERKVELKWNGRMKKRMENGEFEMMKFRSESGGKKEKQKPETMGKVVIALLWISLSFCIVNC